MTYPKLEVDLSIFIRQMSHFQLFHELQMTGSRTSVLELFKNLVVLETVPGSRILVLEKLKNLFTKYK